MRFYIFLYIRIIVVIIVLVRHLFIFFASDDPVQQFFLVAIYRKIPPNHFPVLHPVSHIHPYQKIAFLRLFRRQFTDRFYVLHTWFS